MTNHMRHRARCACSPQPLALAAAPGTRCQCVFLRRCHVAQVRGHFRPEFINRVDDFITFDPLQPGQIKQIVSLRAQKLVGRLGERRMKLVLTVRGQG